MSGIGNFGKITALKNKPQQNEAMELLKKLAAQVEPIMKRRGWKVKLLKEMYPTNPNLLGVITDECENLIMDQLIGAQLNGRGGRLGGIYRGDHGTAPTTSAKVALFPGKGYKVGTDPQRASKSCSSNLLTYYENQKKLVTGLYVNQTAWCASEPEVIAEHIGGKKRPITEVIVISDDEDSSPLNESTKADLSWTCPSCTCKNPPLVLQCIVCCLVCPPQAVADKPTASIWICSQCTLINQFSDTSCLACLKPKLNGCV